MLYIICIILCVINICFSCYLFYKNCLLNDEIDSLYNNYSNLLDSTVKHILPLTSSSTDNVSVERSSTDNVKSLIRNY